MNWFSRYGIPGGYFMALMVVWAAVFYPEDLQRITQSLGTQLLAALIVVGFLPIGYILSVTTQSVYLRWRGLHRQALRQVFGTNAFIRFRHENTENAPRDEPAMEARTLLLTVLGSVPAGRVISVQSHEYIRNWIARRMDVLAINDSLMLANILGFLIALIVLLLDCKPWAFLTLSILVTLVTLAMVFNTRMMRRQITQAIVGIYQIYR